jgi:5-methylcytosine-specific restriction endonuclease McrA
MLALAWHHTEYAPSMRAVDGVRELLLPMIDLNQSAAGYECCMDGADYPAEAYAPNGELWWRLKIAPGKTKLRFGGEQKIAAWLAFNRAVGQTFTMRDLRLALGEVDVPDDAEHLNRRLRTLRLRDGWKLPSQKDDGSLAHNEYRVKRVGWHPGTGKPRPKPDLPSDSIRRKVLERDKRTCVVCGIGSRDPYVDMPDKHARMTIGHRIPGNRMTSAATVDELQTECARCNETVRDELPDPVTLEELLPVVRNLKRADKEELLRWLEHGRRPSRVDEAYSSGRLLSDVERGLLVATLREMTYK